MRDLFFYVKDSKVDMISKGSEPELFAVLEKAYNSFVSPPSDFQDNGFPKFIWPSTYEPKFITQAFGVNEDFYKRFNLPGHEGIDMRAPLDQPIIAVWDGEVSRVGWHQAYGNHIRLNHHIKFPTGETVHYESVYAHFSMPSELKIGDKVRQGEVIGAADATGNSKGHHLHFNMKQFNHPELRPKTAMQMKASWPFNLIDATPFFEWLDVG